MLSALVLGFVAAAPVPLDWNGLQLRKALETYGARNGLRLRCETALADEPIFAWSASATPKDVMARVADVMVATWTRQEDGSLRLGREVADRKRLEVARLQEAERLYGRELRSIIQAAHLDEPVTVGEATKSLQAMIASRSEKLTEGQRMRLNRDLDARLAGGRLMARILKGVGTAAFAAMSDQGRLVYASRPTPRQRTIPHAEEILAAFTEEHAVQVRAAEQTGPPPLSTTGTRAQVWFSENLPSRPARLQLRIERGFYEGGVHVNASVLQPNGEIAYSTVVILHDRPESTELPASYKLPADPPDRAGQFEAIAEAQGQATAKTRSAVRKLLVPDPLSGPFGERLRALARAQGQSFIGRVPDDALRFVLRAPAHQAMSRLLESTTLATEDGWLTLRLRDPLAAEFGRAPRAALVALVDSAIANQGQPRASAVLDYVRQCPDGIEKGLAGAVWPYVGRFDIQGPLAPAVLHVVAACDRGDFAAMAEGGWVPVGRLGKPVQAALERIVFRHPLVHFQAQRKMPQGVLAITMGEICEPTFRVPGPLAGNVSVRLRSTATEFATVDDMGIFKPLTPVMIAATREGRSFPRYERFSPGVQHQFTLEIAIDGDTTFTAQAALTDVDLQAPSVPYERLPNSLRRRVEEQLSE